MSGRDEGDISRRRSVQTILINQNIVKWLISLLNKADRLSDYTLGKDITVPGRSISSSQ